MFWFVYNWFLVLMGFESEQKPKHCQTWDFLSVLIIIEFNINRLTDSTESEFWQENFGKTTLLLNAFLFNRSRGLQFLQEQHQSACPASPTSCTPRHGWSWRATTPSGRTWTSQPRPTSSTASTLSGKSFLVTHPNKNLYTHRCAFNSFSGM